jgi:hypothetical protein
MPGGLGACLAFSYSPHALQMILPLISRRHNGVDVVPQFLESVSIVSWEKYEHSWPDIDADRDSAIVPVMVIGSNQTAD